MLQTLQIVIMLLGAFSCGYLFRFYLNDKLIKHITELKAQVDSLSTKLAWSESEKNKMAASLSAANLEMATLKNELNDKQNALAALQADIEQLQLKAEALEMENALAAESIASLREQLQSGDSASLEQLDRIERLHAELNKAKSDNTMLLNEKEKLNASLTDLNTKFQETENVLGEYSSLSDAMKAEYEKLQEENNVAAETIATLREELQLGETEITEQITKIEQLQDALTKIREEHSSTATVATTLQTDFENLNNENAELKNSLMDFEAQVESLYGELENNRVAILTLQEENGSLRSDFISLENEAGQAQMNGQEAENKLVQLQNEKAALEKSVTELIKENEEMMESMSKLYESEVMETEAAINPVQIEDEVEATVEEKTEISATVSAENDVIHTEAEIDSDDVIPDDLKLVEGIGPKIQELLYNSGIKTFQRLSTTPVEHIRRILVLAGDRFAVHDPKSWTEQAKLAAENNWDELKTFQEKLAAEAEKTEAKS